MRMPTKMNQFVATKGGKNVPAMNQKEDKPSKVMSSGAGKNEKKQVQKPAG
jgi:hypothetical protein